MVKGERVAFELGGWRWGLGNVGGRPSLPPPSAPCRQSLARSPQRPAECGGVPPASQSRAEKNGVVAERHG